MTQLVQEVIDDTTTPPRPSVLASAAAAARDNDVPVYAAVPHPTIDWSMADGLAEIPIEERDHDEVRRVGGTPLFPSESPVANHVFDVTPACLVTGIITERGVCRASREGLLDLYSERRGVPR